MVNATQVPFELGLVSDALTLGNDLYVRTYEVVARVSERGDVTVLHMFGAQSPLAFRGLVFTEGRLWTVDRPLNGRPVLLELSLAGDVRRHDGMPLHLPTGLTVLNGHPLVLDFDGPVTRLLAWSDGTAVERACARTLTHWTASGEALHFSDAQGLHRLSERGVEELSDRTGIQTFHGTEHVVTQWLDDGWPVFSVITPEGGTTVRAVDRPVAFHPLPSGVFVRFRNRIGRADAPGELRALPDAVDLGKVLAWGGGLAYIRDDRQLHWSADTENWTVLEPVVRASDLVAVDATQLVISGRRTSAWVTVD
ncbi:hypothetical protein [Deinococcus enclensis]|uniref:Uncharacterized protein n=1 Tax=Deinococcus enclensis TaxID=1049582 RepID=A0ABT9MFL0_9DEIO|nr:hypothetical protein [Deinococcus enclensis]MDP9765397.1 hypothetical protein [Deinococcus enclensis]